MSEIKFKKNNVSQKINLKEEFGIDFRGKDDLKQAIGQAIIDKIVKRTLSGEGRKFTSDGRGVPFNLQSVPYSKSYRQSKEFKAFGKTSKVNLKLTGDMLGLLDIKSISGNSITIGWDDPEENAKAYNHSVGDTVKARPFFGVSKKDLKEIKSQFKDDIKRAIEIKKEEGLEAFRDFILKNIADINKKDG